MPFIKIIIQPHAKIIFFSSIKFLDLSKFLFRQAKISACMKYSTSKENYLKAIYHLQEAGWYSYHQ